MAEHPGAEYFAAFDRREVERLEAVAEARCRPGSIWFQSNLWDGAAPARDVPSEGPAGVREPSRSRTRVGTGPVSVTPECECCGRGFVGRRADARFCGEVCRQRSRRGRCEVVS